MENEVRLNLGSGNDYMKGMINLDIEPSLKPDMVADINRGLPFRDGSIDYIKANDIIEHLDNEGICEVHRVLKPGGRLEVRVPHFACRSAYNDFTHKHFFNTITLRNSIFKRFKLLNQKVHYDFANHRIVFCLPETIAGAHERLLPGVLPPSHITATLTKENTKP
jgi:predicted SAM-dependent methyltransferase